MFTAAIFRRAALAAGLLAGTLAATATAGHAATARSGVPWSHVGPGWELVDYSLGTAGTPPKPGLSTLYLVSPSGQKYALHSWPAKAGTPSLLDWSGDKTRALMQTATAGQLEQINLMTGKVSFLSLAGQANAVGYARPGGQAIIGTTLTNSGDTMVGRYSLTGQLVKVLTISSNGANVIGSGSTLVVSTAKGLELVGGNGGVLRALPVPGTGSSTCRPIRWWSASTVIASCAGTNQNEPATWLWLVPVNGARPAALTPQRSNSSRDLGDMDAWQLPGGLYLQAAGPCGTVQIFRQAANGSLTLIAPAGTTGNDVIETVYRSRMLLNAQTGCPGSTSLLWYDPRTHAEQWLFRTGSTTSGVVAVVPYYSRENA
jgi:hypothetical protein